IQPNTPYCVSGFIEPLRSASGLCGPKNNNATCLGTDFQCCNSQTWTCGNSTQDCAAGTCYEGACPGDIVWSTDGTRGDQFGGRLCAGIWGDCCNFDGKCGTGAAFCGTDSCQSGNCTWANLPPTGPPGWNFGNSTDGTCGGANGMTCGSLFGECCNKDNVCGSLPSDCGVGCQPNYGTCNTVTSSSSTSSSTTKTSSSVTTSSSTSTLAAISSLPSYGQTCFNNVIGQYSSLGCSSPDPSCLCSNVNFGYGIRDCSNGACGTAIASTVIAYETAYCSSALATRSSATASSKTTTTTTQPSMPTSTDGKCGANINGATCKGSTFGNCCSVKGNCGSTPAFCGTTNLCQAGFGTCTPISTNRKCGSASTSNAISTTTGIEALPSCGQTCFNNMLGQYSSLGYATADPACLCQNINFYYGLRDCSNAVCGSDTNAVSTILAFESSYCASATA
ncbi:hypothetical protein F5882DRAFT_498637, partial [Hyaloscypha sp. PMI_1271]